MCTSNYYFVIRNKEILNYLHFVRMSYTMSAHLHVLRIIMSYHVHKMCRHSVRHADTVQVLRHVCMSFAYVISLYFFINLGERNKVDIECVLEIISFVMRIKKS